MEEHEIENIKDNKKDVQDQAFEMLKAWRRKADKAATPTNLCIALLKENLKAIASETFGEDIVKEAETLLSQKREGDFHEVVLLNNSNYVLFSYHRPDSH